MNKIIKTHWNTKLILRNSMKLWRYKFKTVPETAWKKTKNTNFKKLIPIGEEYPKAEAPKAE